MCSKYPEAGKGRFKRTSIMALFAVLLVLFISPAVSNVRQGPLTDDPLVTIDILSKQVRLIREGSLKELTIIAGNSAVMTDTLHDAPLDARSIAIINDGGLRVMAGTRELPEPVRLKIDGTGDESVCRVKLQGEERRYPLPMTIMLDASGLRISVVERLNRYAVDSARAEYGMAFWKDGEAVMALAHIIAARCRYGVRSRAHDHADVCDLTHCQVYRGRTGGGYLEDAWMIDHAALSESLFFHSRCGGITFDTRVFSDTASPRKNEQGCVRDYLFNDGTRLCQGPDSGWDRSITREELLAILYPDSGRGADEPFVIRYDMKKPAVTVSAGDRSVSYPPETFRLVVNRVKGWNFIKSNNYIISEKKTGDGNVIRFKGEGLGHGVGFCQHGAAALSRRGYTRYEILEHYYPGLSLKPAHDDASTTPYLSYCMFDLASGTVSVADPGPNFLKRRIPPGSIFKLIVSLYLAAERPDIFNEYAFTCTGINSRDPLMPERCWSQHGHGTVQLKDAIPYSCNLYFASLHNRISVKNFSAFFSRFCRCVGINASLPEFAGEKEWSNMLAGLDFRLTFTVGDYIKLVRFLNCGETAERSRSSCDVGVSDDQRLALCHALRETCIRGTAGGATKQYGAECNYRALPESLRQGTQGLEDDAWGKTSTVIDGTNRPMSYGMFIGGAGRTGIVAVLRKSNGHMTARWARLMLSRHKGR